MGLESWMGDGYIATKLEDVINWCRKNSLYPMPMGISCCAIEMMAAAGPRFDIARFGSEVMRFTPRQCDVIIVAGTTTFKMAKVVRKIYDQMPEPKWVIAMGIDQFLPVDVYVAGCPPRPDNLLNGLMLLQQKVQRGESRGMAPAYVGDFHRSHQPKTAGQ
jgi:NADH-quinone oxidoreductase subunit B